MDATRRGRRTLAARFAVSRLAPSLLALAAVTASAAETVELMPDRRAGWSALHLLAPITGLFLGGPGYWYDRREIEVDTSPPGALLDLFYVRGNMQRAYEQAEAPVRLLLPSRIEATARDSVTIRALLLGHGQKTVHVRVRSRESRIVIDLEPLPNRLLAVGQVFFAERGLLRLALREQPSFRLMRGDGGVQLILVGTALDPAAEEMLEGVSGPLVTGLRAQQLGEDLVIQIQSPGLASGELELRNSQRHDPVRRQYEFQLQLTPPDRGARGVRRAREALARIGPEAVSGCARSFDEALREALEPAGLARALSVEDPFTGRYLRAALRRLGEISPGGYVTLVDGSRHRGDLPLELEAAASRASEARGYLALLRAFAAELEPPQHREAALRGLVAPDLPPSRFAAALAVAREREGRCAVR